LSISIPVSPSTAAVGFSLCVRLHPLSDLHAHRPSVPYLAGAHGAPIAVQHPDLPTVLDLVVMDTVTGAVVAVRAPAVVASVQVEAHGVVGTGVPPRFAFINICRERNTNDDIIHMLSAEPQFMRGLWK